jgi:hypothetical protein
MFLRCRASVTARPALRSPLLKVEVDLTRAGEPGNYFDDRMNTGATMTAMRYLLPAFGLGILLTAGSSQTSRADEFTDACLAAEIFTAKDCSCIKGKATDEERALMITWLTADKVKKEGGEVDETTAIAGMAAMSKHTVACDKAK